MKLARHYLEQIEGVELFPLIAMGIFFAMFVIIGIRVFKMNKTHIAKMSSMPINDNEENVIHKS